MGGANLAPTRVPPTMVARFPYNSTPPVFVATLTLNETVQFPFPSVHAPSVAPQFLPYPLSVEFKIGLGFGAISGNRFKIPRGTYRISVGGGSSINNGVLVVNKDTIWAQYAVRLNITPTISAGAVLDVGTGLKTAPNDPYVSPPPPAPNERGQSVALSMVARISEPVVFQFTIEDALTLDAAGVPRQVAATDYPGPPFPPNIFVNLGVLFELIDF